MAAATGVMGACGVNGAPTVNGASGVDRASGVNGASVPVLGVSVPLRSSDKQKTVNRDWRRSLTKPYEAVYFNPESSVNKKTLDSHVNKPAVLQKGDKPSSCKLIPNHISEIDVKSRNQVVTSDFFIKQSSAASGSSQFEKRALAASLGPVDSLRSQSSPVSLSAQKSLPDPGSETMPNLCNEKQNQTHNLFRKIKNGPGFKLFK